MKTLTLNAPLNVGPHVTLYLTTAQLAPRAHNLEVLKRDRNGATVRTIAELSFKAGETIKADPDALPKAIVADLRAGDEAAEAAEDERNALQAARDEGHAAGRASAQVELQAARDEGVSTGRTAMLDEFDLYHDALDDLADAVEAVGAAKAALAAETEESERKPLEEAVARAQKAADDAAAQADQLKPKA